jgi:hypothetical protein
MDALVFTFGERLRTSGTRIEMSSLALSSEGIAACENHLGYVFT